MAARSLGKKGTGRDCSFLGNKNILKECSGQGGSSVCRGLAWTAQGPGSIYSINLVWWQTLVIPAVRERRQEDQEVLGYVVSSRFPWGIDPDQINKEVTITQQ